MVKWTANAKNQLRQIYKYIAKDSPSYARRVTEELVKHTIDLDKLPHRSRVVPELNDDSIRERSLYSYRILYEINDEDLVSVLAIIHKRQHLDRDDLIG